MCLLCLGALLSCFEALILVTYRIICTYFAGKSLVGMAEVEAAIQEMFQALHIQVSEIISYIHDEK